ncbi:YslB family protein [Bacillus tianshenii]|nr:YslB family protein [Bacillus tianshenii]
MKSSNLFSIKQATEELQCPAFAYELMREVLLPDLLSEDYEEISYFAGKRLARKFPLETVQELNEFFETAGWGTLQLIKDKKITLTYELTSPLIEKRFNYDKAPSFHLEAGFLAEQIQQINGTLTESSVELKPRQKKAVITVQSEK